MPRQELPNSPLVEVACEIRFHGELSLMTCWASLQDELRAEYPALLVPGAVAGVSPLLQPMRLATEDQRRFVLLSINSLAYVSREYSTVNVFHEEFQRVYEAFRRHCRVDRYTRLGLRYVNSLPPVFEETRQHQRLHPCLRLEVAGWSNLPSSTKEQPQFVFQGEVGSCNLRISLLDSEVSTNVVRSLRTEMVSGVQFDLDCYVDTDVTPGRVVPFLDEAHGVIDGAFFDLITPEYLEYLRGEG